MSAGLTNERAEDLVAEATDFPSMLEACRRAFEGLYQPLRDTQENDVPVRAAIIALAVRRRAMAERAE